MAKIHIVGGPGSGKTTLAQDLSSRFHVPHYDLDKVNWEKVFFVRNSSDRERLLELLTRHR